MMKKKTRVEVQRDGVDGAWMEGVVEVAYGRGRGRRYKVRYDHKNSDGPFTEDVPFTRIRPIPPQTPHNYNYSIQDAVEVNDRGCWRQGIITQVLFTKSRFFRISFPHTGTDEIYHRTKLRPAQKWLEGKWFPLPLQQTNNAIYERKYVRAVNSGMTSIASSPWDVQTDAHSQRQFEEVNSMATLDVEAIGNRNSRTKTFKHGKAILKNAGTVSQGESTNVEQNQRMNLLAPPSKGIKRVHVHDCRTDRNYGSNKDASTNDVKKGIKRAHVHDCRKDRTYGGDQDAPTNEVKRFKHTEPSKTTVRIRIKSLKNIETRTELDNRPRKNHPLNMVAEQRLQTHDRELMACRSVLRVFHAQGNLTRERNDLLTSLRHELHITNDEYTDELKKLIAEP